MICFGVHLPFESFEQENWSNQPNVEDIRKSNISIKDYFTKWRLKSIERNFNNKEAKREAVIMKKIKISNNSNKPEVKAKRWILTIPCIVPGCNGRYYNNNEEAENHMEKEHDINYFNYKKICKIIQNTNYNEDCGICCESLSNGEIIRHLPNCKHIFHTGCIKRWLKNHQTCPLCRTPTDCTHDPELVRKYHSTYIKKIHNSNVEFTHIDDNQCRGITNEGRRCKRAGLWCHQHQSWYRPRRRLYSRI